MRPSLFLTQTLLATLTCMNGIAAAQDNDPPGDMKLLHGYEHKQLQGIDTLVGEISKKGGLKFTYVIGFLAGNYASHLKKNGSHLWYKEQTVRGAKVQIAFAKDRTLYVTFPDSSASFFGKTKSEEDLVDMLLMVLTYPRKTEAKPDKTDTNDRTP